MKHAVWPNRPHQTVGCIGPTVRMRNMRAASEASPNFIQFFVHVSSWHDATTRIQTQSQQYMYIYKVIQCCSNKVLHKYLLDYRTYRTHTRLYKSSLKRCSCQDSCSLSWLSERNECHCRNEYKAMNIAISARMNKWVQYWMPLTKWMRWMGETDTRR